MSRLVQDNELFNVVLGVAVLVFLLVRRRALRRLPDAGVLFAAYGALLLAWIATVVEGLLWPIALNYAEHACYALSALLLTVWGWHAMRRAGRDRS